MFCPLCARFAVYVCMYSVTFPLGQPKYGQTNLPRQRAWSIGLSARVGQEKRQSLPNRNRQSSRSVDTLIDGIGWFGPCWDRIGCRAVLFHVTKLLFPRSVRGVRCSSDADARSMTCCVRPCLHLSSLFPESACRCGNASPKSWRLGWRRSMPTRRCTVRCFTPPPRPSLFPPRPPPLIFIFPVPPDCVV